MGTRTVHVLPDQTNGRWIVKNSGASVPVGFATRKEATDEAKRLIKGKAGQVVVLPENGTIVCAESHGLPKVLRAAVHSKLGRKAIERAVSTVVKARLIHA